MPTHTRHTLTILTLSLALASCDPRAATTPAPTASEPSPAEVDLAPFDTGAPPVTPPEPSPRAWLIPDVGQRAPSFPHLPGEDTERSRSIGDVSSGYLFNAHRLAFPDPSIAILKVQSRRHLNYTSDEMVELILAGAAHVKKSYPEAITYIGNLGDKGGGDIPYSVSHNSGRDADIAFFVTDPEGAPAQMPDLLPLDKEGKYEGEHGIYLFDTPRNWALIEGFIKHSGDGKLQYIFVADWLRDMMLEHARTIGADGDTIAAASRLLMQPRASLAHNDHFHLRIYCSKEDVRSGCKNTGRIQPGFNSHSLAKKSAEREALKALEHELAEVRIAAIRRLALLGTTSASGKIQAQLEDPDPLVRAMAARALATLDRGSKNIGKALEREEHPRAHAEMIVALGAIADRAATRALTEQLDRPVSHRIDGEHAPMDMRILIVDALGGMEDERPVKALVALISAPLEAIEGEAPDALEERARANLALKIRTARALGRLTNHRFLLDWQGASDAQRQVAAAQWKGWFEENKRKKRSAWLQEGFVAAGYPVKRLDGKHVWEIARAIEGEDHLSYNAQRVLMRMGKHYPASLTWSKADAYFYWRRWYERRYRRFGAPKIPPELSTLTPKKK